MRLVTLTTHYGLNKVVIDADKVLHMVGTTRPIGTNEDPEAEQARVTEISFQADGNPDGGLVVVEPIDEVVTRIRSAVALHERI